MAYTGTNTVNFFNNLDDKTKCTLSKFVGSKKLGVVDRPYVCATIQQYLDRLEKWTEKNLINFNKRRYKVLNVGRTNAQCQYMLGTEFTLGAW